MSVPRGVDPCSLRADHNWVPVRRGVPAARWMIFLEPEPPMSSRLFMSRRMLLMFGFVLLGAVASAPRAFAEPQVVADGPQVRKGVTYRTVDDQALALDVAVPAGEGPFPLIVFVHGGGWAGGNRASFEGEIQEAARRGFVAATVSYRLSKTADDGTSVNPFPAALDDVTAAVDFLKAHAAEYRIDTDHVGITGDSAGGHLALLVGLMPPPMSISCRLDTTPPPNRVQAVVNLFGPTNLTTGWDEVPQVRPLLVAFLGGSPTAQPQRYKAASPISYVRADAPPILTLHGTADPIVLVSQAKALDAALEKVGAPHEMLLLEGQGHGFSGAAAEQAREAGYQFFKTHLRPSATP